nr:ribosomal protein S3, mitochondrial [Tanacetum cinerariifolium]
MAKDKVMELIEKFIDLGGIGELIKGIEMMIEIILRNRRIPYGYNFYLNEVKKMRYLLSNKTKTNTLIESVKIKSVYQSASPIAQDISFQPRNKTRSFRSIFSQIVKDIQLVMKKGVEGIRICCLGRLEGAEIARTECKKYGKTSSNVFNHKIDYAPTEVSTRYGISGVKGLRTVHDLVLEDMALKVVELVVFHIEPLNSASSYNWAIPSYYERTIPKKWVSCQLLLWGEGPSNSEVGSQYTDTPVIDRDLSLVTGEHSEGKPALAFSTPTGISLGGTSEPLTLSPDHKPLGNKVPSESLLRLLPELFSLKKIKTASAFRSALWLLAIKSEVTFGRGETSTWDNLSLGYDLNSTFKKELDHANQEIGSDEGERELLLKEGKSLLLVAIK